MTLETQTQSPQTARFKTPDTFVILFVVAMLAWLATWLIPAGRFVSEDGTFDINSFVVSGSGQATLIMPLMARPSELIGVERQTAVLAFQPGDGLMNLIVPSSAVLIACLAAVRVSWGIWLQFLWKGLALAMGTGVIVVPIAVSIGYA